MSGDVAARVAGRFKARHLRYYALPKLRNDPAYAAVAEELLRTAHPVVDVGCGIGLLCFYLRERGFRQPIAGVDLDSKKVRAARDAAGNEHAVTFSHCDAMSVAAKDSSVVMLDVLHYLTPAQRMQFLASVAEAIPAGGVAIVRDAVRDGSWRYFATFVQETFSRAIGWLRVPRLSFPNVDEVVAPFRDRGFTIDMRPMWGRTPFNNYLFVFRRSSDGTTKV